MSATIRPIGAPVVYLGAAPPVATDDEATLGARPGYWWTWTDAGARRWYVCRDATPSAAIWSEMPRPGAGLLDVPRHAELGTAAYADAGTLRGLYVASVGAAYQIVPQDWGRMLLGTSGTLTWTLPLAADVPAGWYCWVKNRTGNNLTISRAGSDTVDGTTSITVSTGTGRVIARSGATTFESAA